MAIAVIGGLITSTMLSLVFVPVMFTVMDDISVRLGHWLKRLSSVTDEDKITDAARNGSPLVSGSSH
ncbi:hypothetical protein D3C72_2545090 [compost metagenome]